MGKLSSAIGALGSKRLEETKVKASDSYEQALAESEKALHELQTKAETLEGDLAGRSGCGETLFRSLPWPQAWGFSRPW